MIELELEYDESGHQKFDKTSYLSINITDKKFKSIEMISNWHWNSTSVAEDVERTQQCIDGTFEEDGELGFHLGYEGSPGIIYVRNNDRAYVEDAYDDEKEDYLILTLEELKDVLQQIYEFLVSIGK